MVLAAWLASFFSPLTSKTLSKISSPNLVSKEPSPNFSASSALTSAILSDTSLFNAVSNDNSAASALDTSADKLALGLSR